jgi:Zn-dependent protease
MTFNPIDLAVWLFAVIVAITIHEAAHAWMSFRLGDPTAKVDGRMSLNPLKHYDPIGTSMLFFTAILRAMNVPIFVFGWAKPVMVDSYNLKNPRKDSALISLSGPAANILLAIALSILTRIFGGPFSPYNFILSFIYTSIFVNVSLAIFNLIPVHPLDGGKVLVGILPPKESYEADIFLRRYGTIMLVMLIFPIFGGSSLLTIIISPIINILLNLLLPGSFF